MDTTHFMTAFRETFSQHEIDDPTTTFVDPLPKVGGMTSPKVQRLFNLACSMLPEDEVYLEVGSYQGKVLLSAALGNPGRVYAACDNFSQFTPDPEGSRKILFSNAAEHLPRGSSFMFFDVDFRKLFPLWSHGPIGVYFYDGIHDYPGQFDGIMMAEPHLADEALVLVDDWDHGDASRGTLDAIARSPHDWELLAALPSRRNGDREQWWYGLGVLSFKRKA